MFIDRLSNKCSIWTRACLFNLGLEHFFYPTKKNADVILMFHNVLEKTNLALNMRNIGVADFERILKYLKRNYQVVTLNEILEAPGTGQRIAITFDDGLVNNLHHALPVLEKHQLPATFFVTTSWLAGRSSLWPDELSRLLQHQKGDIQLNGKFFFRKYRNLFVEKTTGERLESVMQEMDIDAIDQWLDDLAQRCGYQPAHDLTREDEWRVMKGEEIRIMSQSPMISIGSHAVSHVNLKYASDDLLKDELTESKKYLEQVTGKAINDFAFPFGAYDRRVADAAVDAGYHSLIGVEPCAADLPVSNCPASRYGIYNDISTTESLHRINQLFS